MTDLFAHRATGYDERSTPVQVSEGAVRALDERIDLTPDMTVLDFGAGTGLLCGRVAPRVGRVIAVDISPSMLAQLEAKDELRGRVVTVCQNLLDKPLGEQVDLVISAMAMHHVEDTDALLRTLFDHLRPGGRIALADLDREDGSFHEPGTEGVFHQGFDREPLAALLSEVGFEDVAIDTACEVDRHERRYPIFLVTATRPR